MLRFVSPIYHMFYLLPIAVLLGFNLMPEYKAQQDFGLCLTAFGKSPFYRVETAEQCGNIFTTPGLVAKERPDSYDVWLVPLQTTIDKSTFRDIYDVVSQQAPHALNGAPSFETWWASIPVGPYKKTTSSTLLRYIFK
ncbi:hypothetical protein [Aeromonas salmonicida]|uniref:hypothetical protein n=1 Tax=Aeromonas salmonicida TaxID=645 RepID=UPI00240D1E47|nr:hypothetical protein [Aeromonas salmonicida]WFC12695.1 hypothetical protein L3V47_13150 [Aeromonas salmonicida]